MIARLTALGAALAASPALAATGPFFSLRNTDFIVLLAFLAAPSAFAPLFQPFTRNNAPAIYTQTSLLSLTLSHLAIVAVAVAASTLVVMPPDPTADPVPPMEIDASSAGSPTSATRSAPGVPGLAV